jgi:hypothetical protein
MQPRRVATCAKKKVIRVERSPGRHDYESVRLRQHAIFKVISLLGEFGAEITASKVSAHALARDLLGNVRTYAQHSGP